MQQQKHLYAKELTAHTLQQWNSAREHASALAPLVMSGKSQSTAPRTANERNTTKHEDDATDSAIAKAESDGAVTPGSRYINQNASRKVQGLSKSDLHFDPIESNQASLMKLRHAIYQPALPDSCLTSSVRPHIGVQLPTTLFKSSMTQIN
ncbi:hypothetical protein B0H34DRAFT_812206 [Crassisporium funariophilum]|nr:hypothetical protein B0H34DRAFT_812206 [Crassisporium funariophilum]